MEVEPSDYMTKAVEHCQFLNRFLVRVAQTGQVWHGEDDFVLEKPKLVMEAVFDFFGVAVADCSSCCRRCCC